MPSTLSSLQNQNIFILGLGREGLSTLNFLRQHFPDKKITILDSKTPENLPQNLTTDQNLTFFLGKNYLDGLKTANNNTIIFKTPGIPTSLPEIQKALENGAILSSNTQLFFDQLQDYQTQENHHNLTIGITGTKGKSTTSALIHHVLKENKIDAVLAGNIGTAPLSVLAEINPNTTIILELSCHQLAELTHSPKIAVIQEITSEHLDYYPDTQSYVMAKSAICRFQSADDLVIFNHDYSQTVKLAHLSPAQRSAHQDFLQLHPEFLTQEFPNLPGKHNLNNIIPAFIVGEKLGLNFDQIMTAVKSFKSLPHRLQLVAEKNGVLFYNDSLSTTPESAIAGINAFEGKEIVLIAGGYERHQDFKELAEIIASKVKTVVLFPTTGERIWQEIVNLVKMREKFTVLPQHFFVNDMKEAVKIAKSQAQTGEVVLLSPASASFNMFRDYDERGRGFEENVRHDF